MKTWQIARRILARNRWLYLLLVLSPFAMAALLLLPSGSPEAGDVTSILHQQCLYGLALAAFTGSMQLGNEERSRRIVGVLSRAVGRRQYLFALLCAAWIPLAFYAASFLLSGAALAASTRQPLRDVIVMTLTLLLLGLSTASAGVFFAVWLPSALASIATLAAVSASVFVGRGWPGFEFGHLLGELIGAVPDSEAHVFDIRGEIWSWLLAAVIAAAFFIGAAALFDHHDLRLKGE